MAGDLVCVYVVEPETNRYREFSSTSGFDQYALPKSGTDFFETTRKTAKKVIMNEDIDRFLTTFTKDNILTTLEENGFFSMSYRLLFNNKPLFVKLKAAMVEEKEGRRLIVGVNNIDAQIRQEEDDYRRLQAQIINDAFY